MKPVEHLIHLVVTGEIRVDDEKDVLPFVDSFILVPLDKTAYCLQSYIFSSRIGSYYFILSILFLSILFLSFLF